MRITFAGVGAAFDEHLPNTSILMESEQCSLLADCGFTSASAFWRSADDPLSLSAIYLTHFHGDHYFGVPALLLRMVEEGRTAPLTILGQEGVEDRVRTLVDLAYRSILEKARFDLRFVECTPGNTVELNDMRLSFAVNDHPMPCLSLRVDTDTHSVFYSGDGRPTLETRQLADGCDLVVHESFSLEPDTPGHGTVDSSIQFAQEAGAKEVALVHIKRDVRHRDRAALEDAIRQATDLKAFLPEPGDQLQLADL